MSGERRLDGLSVLCTRPSGRGGSLRAKLRALGATSRHIPVLEIIPLNPDAGMREIAQRLDEYESVIWVSPAAAELGIDFLRDWWPQWPMGVNWVAVGSATASILDSAGLPVLSPADHGLPQSSEGLAAMALFANCEGQRFLIVKGVGGRAHLQQTLTERGAKVDELALYSRSLPDDGASRLERVLEAGQTDAALVFSGDALRSLRDMAGRSKNRLDLVPLFVPGERVVSIARDLGFQDVTPVSGPDDEAMLGALLDRFGSCA